MCAQKSIFEEYGRERAPRNLFKRPILQHLSNNASQVSTPTSAPSASSAALQTCRPPQQSQVVRGTHHSQQHASFAAPRTADTSIPPAAAAAAAVAATVRPAAALARAVASNTTPHHVEADVAFEWCFLDDDGVWTPYSSAAPSSGSAETVSSDDIEDHHNNARNEGMLVERDNTVYFIDFKTMTEINLDTRATRDLCRRVVNHSTLTDFNKKKVSSSLNFNDGLPSSWMPMGEDEIVRMVDLLSSEAEYTKVENLMKETLADVKIQKLQRVQNPFLWKAYLNKVAYFQRKNGCANLNEKLLFHGTNPANVSAICEKNLDWRLYGTNCGNAFGQGSYFSNSASVSNGYSTAGVAPPQQAYGNNPNNAQYGHRTANGLSGHIAYGVPGQHTGHAAYGVSGQHTGHAAYGVPGQHTGHAVHGMSGLRGTGASFKPMLVFRVMVGRVTVGNTQLRKPPDNYDTTVNNVNAPTIFVKYDSQEFYPEYYVEYQ